MQKCMYCGSEIDDDRPLTVCNDCGQKVWGQKMFNTIIQNMKEAREKGDLCHTSPIAEVENKFDSSMGIR